MLNRMKINSDPIHMRTHSLSIFHERSLCLILGLSCLLCLLAPELGGLVVLDWPLGCADSGGAGNGVLAEVGAVVALGG